MIFAGIVFVIIGVLMTLYNQIIGMYFCKFGKKAWEKKPIFFSEKEIKSVYNEEKAPSIIKLLGIINVIQGFFFIIIGILN